MIKPHIILNEDELNDFRNKSNIHVVKTRLENKYEIRAKNGLHIGEIEKSNETYNIRFFDHTIDRMRLTQKTNDLIEDIKYTVEDIKYTAKKTKSEKIRNFMQEVPKYYTQPKRYSQSKRLRSHETRMFQPVDVSKGLYHEIISREINGKIIIGHRLINIFPNKQRNIISYNPYERWKYEMAA